MRKPLRYIDINGPTLVTPDGESPVTLSNPDDPTAVTADVVACAEANSVQFVVVDGFHWKTVADWAQ